MKDLKSCRFILVGCGKKKQQGDQTYFAAELYTGPLFTARKRYAQDADRTGRCICWWILSAEHGLVLPWQLIRPYELSMAVLDEVERARWAMNVAHDLVSSSEEVLHMTGMAGAEVEIHAGQDYCNPLEGVLHAIGIRTTRPLESLSQGDQLAWYKHRRQQGGAA
jgi:hypothetical protein